MDYCRRLLDSARVSLNLIQQRLILLYSGSFEVPPGTLAFSVTLFSICAVICLIVLYLRRVLPSLGGAELGGPTKIKTASFGILLSLWFGYVLLSALQTYGIIAGF